MEYQRPQLYLKQSNAFFHDKRYGMIEASTKAGKTVGGMAWLLEQALIGEGQAGHNYWWIAPVYPQAEIAYGRMKRGLPQYMFEANESKLRLTLCNGALIWFKSGEKPDNLYGDDVYAALMDEASRSREEAYIAVRSTLTKTRGKFRAIGNVKGRQNWFYRMCRKAEAGDPDMEFHKIIAADAVAAGVLTQDEIDDARRNLPENAFRELYLAEPSDDGGNPFGFKAISKCIEPLSADPVATWGVDLAKSVDWTVAIGFDKKGRTCRVERFQKPWEDTIRYLRDTIKEPCLVDSTGVGDPVLEALQKDRDNFEGFKFTAQSKQQIMEGLAVAIQQRDITFPEGIVRIELETFEYEYTARGVRYSAPEGMHDDCVCALALANRKRTQPSIGDNVIEALALLNAKTTQKPSLSQFTANHRRF